MYFYSKSQVTVLVHSIDTIIQPPGSFIQENIHQSIYYAHLSHWMKYFPPNQFHVIPFDDYTTNTREETEKLFNFLELGTTNLVIVLHTIRVQLIPLVSRWCRELAGWHGNPE